jgi:hypothetical protein
MEDLHESRGGVHSFSAQKANFDSKAAGSVTFLALSAPRALYNDMPSTILGIHLSPLVPDASNTPNFLLPSTVLGACFVAISADPPMFERAVVFAAGRAQCEPGTSRSQRLLRFVFSRFMTFRRA